MAILDRDGVKIFYEAFGDGPTVLLSHGYSATSAMWKPQVTDLQRDFRIVVWDMRGHGNSDSPDDPAQYSERATVDDMAAILDAVGARTAVIGGLSLGGYMSLAFELAYPSRTSALMVFDTGPGYRKAEGREGWNKTAAALGGGNEVRVSRHRSAQGLAHAARGMLAQVDGRVIERLPHIAVPTLVLVGEKDTPFLAATDYMATKIPGARKVVLKDAGHASNIDQPAAFNRAVRTFLSDSKIKLIHSVMTQI
jgi:pimeloyl-ACP methyl ester carboxylesterase